MKFRAHETFSIRKGWLHKGLSEVADNPTVFVDKNNNPMDVFGIGSNMVKSLRYWLMAVGLTEEGVKGKRGQALTELGQLVLQNDPYLEELGTLWLLHYNLAKGKELSTSWYYFFNHFNFKEFEKEDFNNAISNWAKLQGQEVPSRSVDDDFNCIINTYLPRYKISPDKCEPESNMDCPLSELGLVDISDAHKRIYLKKPPVSRSVDPMVATAVIIDNANGRKEIQLSELLNGENNIGHVFDLDAISMFEILDAAEQIGLVKVVRTAGLDVVKIETNNTFIDCVKQYYENLYVYTEEKDNKI